MKKLNSNSKNFDKSLDILLSKRKQKLKASSVSVTKIINDVKKNGDKALLKYERKFNKNNIIVPSVKQIDKSIKSLDKKAVGKIKFICDEGKNAKELINLTKQNKTHKAWLKAKGIDESGDIVSEFYFEWSCKCR